MSETRQFYWIRQLAKGGMGEIELVVRSEGAFRRLYAVKRLREQFREDENFRAMFTEEARLAGLISHPNVVSVLDVGEDHHGPYLFMDYVEGRSLSEVIRKLRELGKPISVELACAIVAQAAEGLHAAHEVRDGSGKNLGLVHRDVSPQNIMIGFDGTVRVTDFGIAKAFGRSTQTTVGTLKGKLGYVSPEQLGFRALDRRSDIFALGVVFYELLTLKRLYSNKDGLGPERILKEPPPDVGLDRPDVPPQLVELVFNMLEKQADNRPGSAEVVAETLRETMAGQLLLSDGSGTSLSDFMVNHFEHEASGVRTEISSALGLLDTGKLPRWPRPKASEAEPGSRKITPMVIGAMAALTLVLGGVGAGMWIAGDEGNEAQTSIDSSPVIEPEPVSAELEIPEQTEQSPEPVEAVNTEPEAETPPPTERRRPPRLSMRNRVAEIEPSAVAPPAAMGTTPSPVEPASSRLGTWQHGSSQQ